VSLHIDAIINTLSHDGVNFLPRGELFIARNFLDHYFPQYKEQYIKQLETATQCLGLSVIGVELDTEWSDSLLSKMRYKELEQYFTVGCINGPVSRSIENHGFSNAMLSIKNNPSLFSGIVTKLLRDIEIKAKSANANGFRAVAIADDIAGNQGLFFSYDYFMETICPVYKEIAEIIRKNDLFTFFHSDGDIGKIIEPLIDAGYNCIHPIDAQAGVSLDELKKEFGETVSFMGHIDTVAWSEEHINKEISLAEKEFKAGGLILGSTCGISMETVSDKLRALYPGWGKNGRINEERLCLHDR
jgi:uroporphyrinogen-III decarboxylase